MPKRRRESPRIRMYRLSDAMTVRVRLTEHNTDGSVMLVLQEGSSKIYLECVGYKEHQETEYTKEGWIDEYRRLYEIPGDQHEEEAALLEENASAKEFRAPKQTINVSRGALANTDQEARARMISWNKDLQEMELKMEWDCDADIPHTQHTSLWLKFSEIQ